VKRENGARNITDTLHNVSGYALHLSLHRRHKNQANRSNWVNTHFFAFEKSP
jgi:hypothetical protein